MTTRDRAPQPWREIYFSATSSEIVTLSSSSCESPTMVLRKRPWRSNTSCVGHALTPYAFQIVNEVSIATGQTMPWLLRFSTTFARSFSYGVSGLWIPTIATSFERRALTARRFGTTLRQL